MHQIKYIEKWYLLVIPHIPETQNRSMSFAFLFLIPSPGFAFSTQLPRYPLALSILRPTLTTCQFKALKKTFILWFVPPLCNYTRVKISHYFALLYWITSFKGITFIFVNIKPHFAMCHFNFYIMYTQKFKNVSIVWEKKVIIWFVF